MSMLLLETEDVTETERADEDCESKLELYSYYQEIDYDDAAA
jgi:hypothetical protein